MPVMMLLGATVFSVNTNTYSSMTKAAAWQWQSLQVIGKNPRYQYLGKGENTISISGVVYPGQYGSRAQLLLLEQAASLGAPLPMFSGAGVELGAWCVKSYSETQTELFDNGLPRKIEFTLDLVQYASLRDFLAEQAQPYLQPGINIVQDFVESFV